MTANPDPTPALDRIVDQLSQMHQVRGDRPLKEPRPMSSSDAYNGNGQYRALQADVDNLKLNFHDLRTDLDSRFSTLSSDMREMVREINARFDKVFESQTANRPDFYKTIGVFGGVATVLLVIIGGFASLAKTNLDTNIQFTNEKIATQAGIVRDDFAATSGTIADLGLAVKNIVATTVPRPELEYRLNDNRDAIRRITDLQSAHSTQLATVVADAVNLKADVERIKSDIVTRKENESHWDDIRGRYAALVERITELQKEGAGAPLNQQLQDFKTELMNIRGEINQLQGRFLVTPDNVPPMSGKGDK